MPPIFKALATITAWALWISAWVMGLSTFVMGLITGQLYGAKEPSLVFPAFFTVALAYAVLAVVVMRLRQQMQ